MGILRARADRSVSKSGRAYHGEWSRKLRQRIIRRGRPETLVAAV